MGQKVNPLGFRLGVNRTWDSRWYADKQSFGDLLHEDIELRQYLNQRLKQAGVSKIVIERPAKRARVTIHTARPGVVIGKKGADIEGLRQELSKKTGGDVSLNIIEIRKPEIDAKLIADN
ncbi:MAG: 30S ribosomal protein S3, partial [Alphaproteobacteria bacterium MarineAlpha3_Bin7]